MAESTGSHRSSVNGRPVNLAQTRGAAAVLLSALLFTFSAVFAKYATIGGEAKAIHVTMARFIVGLLVSIPVVLRDRTTLVPKKWFWVIGRSVTNVISAILFFVGIQLSDVSSANLLNMTFPILVFILSPFVTRESIPWSRFGLLLLMFIGVWLVILPPGTGFADLRGSRLLGNALAFVSALFAGLSMIALRMARRTESSSTVIFYVMAIGLVINLFLLPGAGMPTRRALWSIVIAGTFGALGQVCLTIGFQSMTASIGSLLSSSRILFGSLMGIFLFGEPVSVMGILGTVIILVTLVVVSLVQRDMESSDGICRPPRGCHNR